VSTPPFIEVCLKEGNALGSEGGKALGGEIYYEQRREFAHLKG
jgi:hypothetical protein